MDADSWSSRFFSASKRYQPSTQQRSGTKWDDLDAETLMGFQEIEMDDDLREEYACPFCTQSFDVVGLCCHIDDEHPMEVKNGVCPVCAIWVGVDMVAHITLQHGNIFKMRRKRKQRKGGSDTTLSLLRRESRERNLRSLLGGSSCIVSSTKAAPDPLLSSFIFPIGDESGSGLPQSSAETSMVKKSIHETVAHRKVQPSLSVEDQEEKAKRKVFVEGLLLSTIFDDDKL